MLTLETSISEDRTCRLCGLAFTTSIAPVALAERMREVLRTAKPRPLDPSEPEALRHQLNAEWDAAASIHMRISFGILADELDGVCVLCTQVGQVKPGPGQAPT